MTVITFTILQRKNHCAPLQKKNSYPKRICYSLLCLFRVALFVFADTTGAVFPPWICRCSWLGFLFSRERKRGSSAAPLSRHQNARFVLRLPPPRARDAFYPGNPECSAMPRHSPRLVRLVVFEQGGGKFRLLFFALAAFHSFAAMCGWRGFFEVGLWFGFYGSFKSYFWIACVVGYVNNEHCRNG